MKNSISFTDRFLLFVFQEGGRSSASNEDSTGLALDLEWRNTVTISSLGKPR